MFLLFLLVWRAVVDATADAQVVSARSSPSSRTESLNQLEQVLAKTLARNAGPEYMETFQFLQDTFECNSM